MKEKLLRFVPARLRNRYGLGIGVFVLYICFFSEYDLYTTLKLRAASRTLTTTMAPATGVLSPARNSSTVRSGASE